MGADERVFLSVYFYREDRDDSVTGRLRCRLNEFRALSTRTPCLGARTCPHDTLKPPAPTSHMADLYSTYTPSN